MSFNSTAICYENSVGPHMTVFNKPAEKKKNLSSVFFNLSSGIINKIRCLFKCFITPHLQISNHST